MDNKLNIRQQCSLGAKKANSILGCITSIASSSRGSDPIPLLNTGETHLECHVQFWAPQYKTDMDILERVQRRAVKMVK